MSTTKQLKPDTRRNMYPGATVGLIAILMAVFLSSCSPSAPAAAAIQQNLSPTQYQTEFLESNTAHLLVDVRTPEEFSTGHIPGAVNIPLDALESRMSELPSDEPIVVYCRSGNRSAEALDILTEAGFTPVYDLGGIISWTAQGLPVQ